jgi:hypothetical protein
VAARRTLAAAVVLAAVASAAGAEDRFDLPFTVASDGEVVLSLSAGCARCDWEQPGREAAALRLSIDGRYSQHLMLARGEAAADYHVLAGGLAAGRHVLTAERDAALSAAGADTIALRVASVESVSPAANRDEYAARSLAPMVYARPNTVGRFTDAPLFMWYEVERTPRGTIRFQYSIIFTNEDGGTPTDRLMATWGRTTDIEYVYSAEVDAAGATVAEDYQGPDHQVLPFRGRREGRHPLLWVATDNNMVKDTGETAIRYAPAPVPFDLAGMSREAVMDANPWLYQVAGKELEREHKIAADPLAAPRGQIGDPRRFAYLEACAEVGTAAVAVAIKVGDAWIASDRGLPEFRIVRDGCFRAAVPMPAGSKGADITAVRVAAHPRPPRNGAAAPPPSTVRLQRVNSVMTLSDAYAVNIRDVAWRGAEAIRAGDHFELTLPAATAPRP